MFETESKNFKNIVAGLFCLGFLLRAIEFILNRSLWCDEALLSVNFLNHDYAALLKPLDNNQSAPILFLWIEKLMFLLFGKNDFALRIFPFTVSIISLYLFFRLAINLLAKNFASLIVMFLFATSIFLLRYTLEVKQYQGDMLLALYFSNRLLSAKNYNNRLFIAEMLCSGIISIWFSNIAVILLVTAGSVILYNGYKKNKKIPFTWFPVFGVWIISFCIYFYFFIYHHPAESTMLELWKSYFPPLNIFSGAFVAWFISSYKMIVFALIPYISKFNPVFYLYMVFAVFGIIELYKKGKDVFIICVLPFFIHLALSFLNKYPVADKFLLYLFPYLYIFLGAGLLYMARLLRTKPLFKKNALGGIACCIIILSIIDLYQLYPFRLEEIKDTLAFAEKNAAPNQIIYINKGAEDAYNFYNATGFITSGTQFVISERYGNSKDYAAAFANMNGSFGILFSHIKSTIKAQLISALKAEYNVSNSFETDGSSCYLFTLK